MPCDDSPLSRCRSQGRLHLNPHEPDIVEITVPAHTTRLRLTIQEMDCLLRLLRTPDQLVTPDQLAHAIWGHEVVSTEAIYAMVSRLRRHLTAAGCPDLITTHRGRGYVFGSLWSPTWPLYDLSPFARPPTHDL